MKTARFPHSHSPDGACYTRQGQGAVEMAACGQPWKRPERLYHTCPQALENPLSARPDPKNMTFLMSLSM